MKIYFYDISRLFTEEEYTKIPAYRKEKADKILPTNDKLRSLAAGFLLSEYAKEKEPPENYRLKNYSCSHSGDFSAVCISKEAVGFDIEKIRHLPDKNIFRIANNFFQNDEFSGELEEFFRIWTLKESVLKLFGKGIFMSGKGFKTSEKGIILEKTKFENLDVYLQTGVYKNHIYSVATLKKEKIPDIILYK